MGLGSIRKSFSKLLNKLPINLRNAASLLPEKKGNLVKMLATAALVASLTSTLLAFGTINRSAVIGSRGTVNLPVGVGFYWNRNCTNPVFFIDWGAIEPGSTVNLTIFVRNEGSQVISLKITAENWDPTETTSYMIFSSDYTGQAIKPQESLQLTLSLTTLPEIEGITSLSFDVNVAINSV